MRVSGWKKMLGLSVVGRAGRSVGVRSYHASGASQAKFLVGVDGSKQSINAIHKAKHLMKAADTAFLIHVMEPVEIGKFKDSTLIDPAILAANEAKRKSVQLLKQQIEKDLKKSEKQQFTWVSKEGKPGDEICKFIYENSIDYLVMSDRGLDDPKRFFLGSICNFCVHHAPCSVIIVKDEAAARNDYFRKEDEDDSGSSTPI
eukprot:TRINITY_DN725_c0_g1_i1.p1 TRINITY_DN725_c0_g1~~TRINITY_DN725_c0_g1_i1.p1  ORF type:complete len:202 (+),score=40.37 TRINITY_DN725_c0_g1_i1:257-862(+)